MTVFRPSFPPDSWTTTRMVSPLFSAARAEAWTRNWGTAGARATSAVEENAPFRKLRRDVVMAAPSLAFPRPLRRAPRARPPSPITSQLRTRSTRLRQLDHAGRGAQRVQEAHAQVHRRAHLAAHGMVGEEQVAAEDPPHHRADLEVALTQLACDRLDQRVGGRRLVEHEEPDQLACDEP